MTEVRTPATKSGGVNETDAIQAVDATWMTGALSQGWPGVRVLGCDVVDVMRGSAVKLRVRLEYNSAGSRASLPSTMIIKGLFDRQKAVWMKPTIAGEMYAYRDVVAPSSVNAPAIYFTGEHPTPGHPIIIMEDLAARGVIFNHATQCLTVDAVKAVLTNLAKFHAYWWNSPMLASNPIGEWIEPTHGGSMKGYLDSRLVPEVWARYALMPRAIGLPKKFKDASRVKSALDRLRQTHDDAPKTALHGDLHLGNTFIDVDGSGGAYDWCVRLGSWHHDISYFLANAMDVMDRRMHERSLLEFYLKSLAERGITPPAFEEAWLGYRMNLLYGLIIWIANGDDAGQFQPEAVNTAGAVRHAWAAVDHHTLELLT